MHPLSVTSDVRLHPGKKDGFVYNTLRPGILQEFVRMLCFASEVEPGRMGFALYWGAKVKPGG